LDFYTEVQDLSYLENLLNTSSPRYASLNIAICSLIEDYALVGFETLAVEVRTLTLRNCNGLTLEQDKNSMLHLTRAIDRATGYIYVPPTDAPSPADALNPTNTPPSHRPNTYALFSSAAGQLRGPASDIRDVQERWIDARDKWDAFEKIQWRREGELAAKEAKLRERH